MPELLQNTLFISPAFDCSVANIKESDMYFLISLAKIIIDYKTFRMMIEKIKVVIFQFGYQWFHNNCFINDILPKVNFKILLLIVPRIFLAFYLYFLKLLLKAFQSVHTVHLYCVILCYVILLPLLLSL